MARYLAAQAKLILDEKKRQLKDWGMDDGRKYVTKRNLPKTEHRKRIEERDWLTKNDGGVSTSTVSTEAL